MLNDVAQQVLNNSANYSSLSFYININVKIVKHNFRQHPLVLRNRHGEDLGTGDLDEAAVIVVLASALPEWLLRGAAAATKFFAAPHAVPSLGPQLLSRTVFARMKVDTSLHWQ